MVVMEKGKETHIILLYEEDKNGFLNKSKI